MKSRLLFAGTLAILSFLKSEAQGTWTQKANFGGTARSLASAFVANGKAYMGLGDSGTKQNDLWAYTPPNIPCTAPDIATGLQASYEFSGNANDTTGNGYTGINYNVTLTTDRFGTVNSAFSFNGSTSYIDVPNSTSINFSNGISFVAWIMPTAFTNASVVDAMSGSGNGFRTNTRDNSSPSPIFWSSTGNYNTGIQSVSTSQYAVGTWYNITGTWGTDDSVRVYFNGQLQQTKYAPYNFNNTNPIYIGRGRQSSTYEFFNGKIDDIRIYNRALTLMFLNYLILMPQFQN